MRLELKPPITLGIISEILLVVGVLLFSWGGTQFSVGCGLGVYNCGSYAQLELQTFYLALVILMASAVAFLFFLNATRKESATARAHGKRGKGEINRNSRRRGRCSRTQRGRLGE